MRKVIVIGCPGAGKSTFARALHEKSGLSICHLDLLYWNSDRTTVPKSVFTQRLLEVLNRDSWIIDGNYDSTMEMRMQYSDTVFFLDYPLDVCLEGVRSRKGKERLDMPWVEESNEAEDEEFISFIRNYPAVSRPVVLDLLKKYSQKNIVVIHTRQEADQYLHT